MFRKFVCIYLIVYSSIGSNGPFPLPKYCALPIASLDLIVCIYCLNDGGGGGGGGGCHVRLCPLVS